MSGAGGAGWRVIHAIEWLNTRVGLLAGITILISTLIVFYEVVMRYAFSRPTTWVNDLASYLLIYSIFFAVAYTHVVDGHIRVDIILMYLSPRAQTILNLITSIPGLCFTGILFWKSLELTWHSISVGSRISSIWGPPTWPSQIPITIGSFLFSQAIIIKMIYYVASLMGKIEPVGIATSQPQPQPAPAGEAH